jgi:hypothetical protein
MCPALVFSMDEATALVSFMPPEVRDIFYVIAMIPISLFLILKINSYIFCASEISTRQLDALLAFSTFI